MKSLDFALRYSELGLHVIPLWHVIDGRCACPRGARCDPRRRGKHPRFKDWQHRATVDRREIERWFHHGGNIGIVCGPSGIAVIDVDHPEFHDENGFQTLAELERGTVALPTTWTADTGGGGVHFAYREPSHPLVAKAGPGIEVLTGPHYFVAYPSVHPSGRGYAWRTGLAPWDVSISELPVQMSERLRRPESVVATAVRERLAVGEARDFYDALKALEQGYVLERISGDWLVCGQVIKLSAAAAAGRRGIVINGMATTGFIDACGHIGHHATDVDRRNGGPYASTWLRYYGHDDATIRQRLCELVPELARFSRGARRLSKRSPSPFDLRGDR